jgi:protein-tyrosine phosphatase
MTSVLFLCTGNYYRSRFAEELFNAHADTRRLGWRAISRPLAAIERGPNKLGPVSIHVLTALTAKGLGFGAQSVRRNSAQFQTCYQPAK